MQSVFAALWIVLFLVFLPVPKDTDYNNFQAYVGLYTMLAVLGTMLILVLQATVSLAIIFYFQANHPEDAHWFQTLLCPIIALISQSFLVYVLVKNIPVIGGTATFFTWIPVIGLAVIVIGLVWGFIVRFAAPDTYARIGRIVNDG